MAAHKSKSKELTFSDLTFEVQKLTTAQFAHGKESKEYLDQHKRASGIVKSLNSMYGHGYASLSKARAALAIGYIRDKEQAEKDLKKALQNKNRG